MKDGHTYLGDGLYAIYDGLMVTLYAERDGVTHYVCLESDVLAMFLKFLKDKEAYPKVTL